MRCGALTSTWRNGADATGLCDGVPRLFVVRLIAIATSTLKHAKSYRGRDASASPDDAAVKHGKAENGLSGRRSLRSATLRPPASLRQAVEPGLQVGVLGANRGPIEMRVVLGQGARPFARGWSGVYRRSRRCAGRTLPTQSGRSLARHQAIRRRSRHNSTCIG